MKKIFNNKNVYAFAKAIIVLIIFNGCEPDDENLELATFPSIAEVFTDVPVNLTDQFFVSFDPNSGANTNGFGTDNTTVFEGDASIRIDVPIPNDPDGNFIGGIFLDRGAGRNLTQFNTLSFYALGTTTATFDVGFGTDFETDTFPVSTQIELRTGWNKYFIPIPDASRLVQERGMFLFAAGTASTGGVGYTIFLDEIRFENTNMVALNGGGIQDGENQVATGDIGDIVTVSNAFTEFDVTGGENSNSQSITLNTAPAYFDFISSNESVATVNELGEVTILDDEGFAVITASLNGNPVAGSLTIGMEPLPPSPNVDDSGASQVSLPVGFESTTLTYNIEGFEGAASAIEANPNPSGINQTGTVLRSTKTEGAQFFAGTLLNLDAPIDFSTSEILSIKTFSPKADIPIRIALENQAIGGDSQVFIDVNTNVVNEWEELIYNFTGQLNPGITYDRVIVFFEFIEGVPGDGSTYFYDDLFIIGSDPINDGGDTGGNTGDNLLSNGDFEQGMVTWTGNAFNVLEDGGNNFNQSDNEISGNPFDVNLSHPVALESGVTYTFSFDAATSAEDGSRTIIAGIGLNEGSFEAAVETVTVTSDLQTYTLTLTPPLGSTNSRALFDLGADDGLLILDNVILTTDSDTGGGEPEELLENGDFEQGMVTWFGNAFNVVEDGGNNFNQSDNEISGNPFDVNLSHPVELVAGSTYTLSFDASTSTEDVSRTIIAGIGINEGSFEAAIETVTVTSTTQTFTLTLTPPLGGANSRVLFDLGADDVFP